MGFLVFAMRDRNRTSATGAGAGAGTRIVVRKETRRNRRVEASGLRCETTGRDTRLRSEKLEQAGVIGDTPIPQHLACPYVIQELYILLPAPGHVATLILRVGSIVVPRSRQSGQGRRGEHRGTPESGRNEVLGHAD
jgi:hypothetical protein